MLNDYKLAVLEFIDSQLDEYTNERESTTDEVRRVECIGAIKALEDIRPQIEAAAESGQLIPPGSNTLGIVNRLGIDNFFLNNAYQICLNSYI